MTLSSTTLFNKAWDSLKDQLPLVAGLTLIYFTGLAAFSMIPFFGGFLTGPFTAGYMICLLKISKKQDITYRDVFWGFLNLNRFAQLLVLGLLHALILGLGLILFLIPGIWFAVAGCLSTSFFVLDDSDAIGAIKKSLAAVKGHWLEISGLLTLVFLLLLAGAVCFLLGLLIATPVSTMMFLYAAESLAILPPTEPKENQSSELLSTSSVMTVNPS